MAELLLITCLFKAISTGLIVSNYFKIKKPNDRATTGFNSFISKGRGEPFERVVINISFT
jgi:hypothetical protein